MATTLPKKASLATKRGAITAIRDRLDQVAAPSGVITGTKRKPRRDDVPEPDVAGMARDAMKPGDDIREKANEDAILRAREEGKNEGIKIGGDAEKRIQKDLAAQKATGESAPAFFSAHDRAKYDRAQKLAEQGLSVAEIAQRMDKMIFGAAKNAPGSLEGLPDNFLTSNNLTLERPGQKTRAGLTPDAQWEKLFPKQNPPPVAAAPIPPAEKPFQDVLGPAWAAQEGEDSAALRSRRADLIRETAAGGTKYGTVGVGVGEVLPNVPGAENPAGARGFTSPYGSGFATGMPLPSAMPATPAPGTLPLPSAVASADGLPAMPGLLPPAEAKSITYAPRRTIN